MLLIDRTWKKKYMKTHMSNKCVYIYIRIRYILSICLYNNIICSYCTYTPMLCSDAARNRIKDTFCECNKWTRKITSFFLLWEHVVKDNWNPKNNIILQNLKKKTISFQDTFVRNVFHIVSIILIIIWFRRLSIKPLKCVMINNK